MNNRRRIGWPPLAASHASHVTDRMVAESRYQPAGQYQPVRNSRNLLLNTGTPHCTAVLAITPLAFH